ncbi:MarR family winged helix-turn-helix transcriptional regulator [Leptospira sp. GIMC2001]|uniref:MarR family winged helix-turn-helix transcriptional regulator n=1 Tax=Leptospira sp. GIMC2001 TaxID=1513297 RepID=UPI0023496191|nr:MarR family transcriptional regulator [Leptospira sp. GIMC2001]WCL49210.1 MarR family transcriptional regulator [Leptospira sp. GIMC2001]
MKERFQLEDSYAYLIYRTVRALRRQFVRLAAEVGYELYPEQWFVLVRIYNNPGCSQIELAKDFEDRPSMTRALRSMKEKGWLSISDDPEDRRKHRIELTEAGLKLFELMVKAVSKERNRMFETLDEKDFKHFRRIMDTIFTNAME